MGSACLLVDVENFFLARERSRRNGDGAASWDEYDFATDLGHLVEFARELAGGRRLVVRRGYADFNVRRHAGGGGARWDYYLRDAAQALMRRGIEPVQVFRFPGMASKNAADMRLAMDAAALANGPADVDTFLLVTGDSDYIPLALELRRTGATVIVIGLKHGRSRILPQFVDRFEYFESWLAQAERRAESGSDIARARELLATSLAESSPLALEEAESLLLRSLDPPLDPERFDVMTIEEVIRENASELGVVLTKDESGAWWLEAAPVTAPSGEASGAPLHSPRLYRRVLLGRRGGRFSLFVAPEREWLRITELAWELSRRDGEPIAIDKRELDHEIGRRLEEEDDTGADPSRVVRAVLFQLFKSGCYVCAAEGPEFGQTDFHWSLPARLGPDLADLEALRRRSRAYLLRTLHERLVDRGITDGIDPHALAELLIGPDPSEEAVARVRTQLESVGIPVLSSAPEAAPPGEQMRGEIVPAPRGSLPTPPAAPESSDEPIP